MSHNSPKNIQKENSIQIRLVIQKIARKTHNIDYSFENGYELSVEAFKGVAEADLKREYLAQKI